MGALCILKQQQIISPRNNGYLIGIENEGGLNLLDTLNANIST